MLTELGTDATQISLLDDPRRELVVYVAPDGAHLAWQVTIPAREPLGTWEAFWDAQTGERISPVEDRNYYVDGTGRVFDPNAVVATGNNSLTDQNNSASAVPSSAYSTVTLPSLDGSGFLSGPFVNTGPTSNRVKRSNNDFTDLNRQNGGFEEVMTYWSIDDAQRYIQSFGILNAANYSIPCNVNGITDDNSFYSSRKLTFGTGGVDDAEDAEIILHEYGHAILDDQVPGINQNFDGMGEGCGDYWAATNAVRHPSTNHAQYDPAVGEWDAVSYNPGNPPFLRRVDTDAHYPEDRSNDPHVTGMIWSGALWDIHNALGRLTADRIFLQGNFLLPFSPTLPQAAQAMLQADQNINSGANQAAMTAVFQARGLNNPPTSSIKVTSPNGGEIWQVGNTRTITWTSTAVSGNLRIRLSRNGGSSFTTLINSTANTGSATWTVTGSATTSAIIRVQSVNDSTIYDQSDATFTIADAPSSNSVTVTAPNGRENWPIGSTRNITWTTTGSIANVKIELSRNGIAGPFETLLASTPNDGLQNWAVTGGVTTNAFIRISDAANPSTADTSNAAFTISNAPPPSGSITLIVPNGGERWRLNSTQTIQWTSANVTGNVMIELSRDGGSTFTTLFASTANDRSENWTVTGPTTNQALIRISSVNMPSVSGTSGGTFRIVRFF
jgi:hypothetical protein